MQYALEEFSVVTDSEDFMRVPLPILTQLRGSSLLLYFLKIEKILWPIKQFLCDDNINATREEQIFQVSLKWLKAGYLDFYVYIFHLTFLTRCLTFIKEDENRAEKAFDVLKCTRLALLAPRFLLDEVENNDLFKVNFFYFIVFFNRTIKMKKFLRIWFMDVLLEGS